MKKTIIIVIFLSFVNNLIGQSQQELTGIVLDQENKAIPYVNILLPSQSIGTITNNDGDFVLKGGAGIKLDTLVVSCIGFETLKLDVTKLDIKEKLTIQLKQSTTEL